jgi:hypothetical protein
VVRGFGITPKVSLLSHSQFGTAGTESACKMRETVKRLREVAPELQVEGEMRLTRNCAPVYFPIPALTERLIYWCCRTWMPPTRHPI